MGLGEAGEEADGMESEEHAVFEDKLFENTVEMALATGKKSAAAEL
jgi:hypothetical protein